MVKRIHKEFMNVVRILVNKKIKSEPICAVILGGSVAREDETEYSDIDIVFYVEKKNMPKDSRRFYRFKGKYIEEHYLPIENLKNEEILPESKIIYDATGKLKTNKFDELLSKRNFILDLNEAKESQKLAVKNFERYDYDKSFSNLYGLKGPSFILMHSLPQRFNLPFPSFRLLKSLKKIDREHNTWTYEKIKEIYQFQNNNDEDVLRIFSEAYFLMNKIKKADNPNSKNFGFFDKTKINYNLEGLKKTFEEHPFVFAYRFIVGCLVMWAFDEGLKEDDRKILYKLLLNVLGIKIIDKFLVKEKLELSKELLEESEKLK